MMLNNYTVEDVVRETEHAIEQHGEFASPHEAMSVLDEEVFELRMEIYKKRDQRNISDMYTEAIQIAAVALKFANSLRG